MKYAKKTDIVDAVMYDGQNGEPLKRWSDGKVIESPVLEVTPDNPNGSYVQVYGVNEIMTAGVGDYIVKQRNNFFSVQKRVFEAAYSRVDIKKGDSQW